MGLNRHRRTPADRRIPRGPGHGHRSHRRLARPLHGPVLAGYGIAWLDAAAADRPDLRRMRLLAGLMFLGGLGRLATRATLGRPHPFHDVLLAVEVAAPFVVEVAARGSRSADR
ncbi:DUF4345 domain-containing protein [Pseudonocardia sp. EV170527-09]|uniref:DUF4345 domain-containing protein n=1 Tax=Pseudonocardia sp. EV170527-09 TaxID=2603411 RepID=UPI0013870542|nr:DUF4345 domain-containing protein [Pseudonocardia sp. EV170527-09]